MAAGAALAAARPRGPVRPGPAGSMAKHHRTPARSAEPVIEVKSKVSACRAGAGADAGTAGSRPGAPPAALDSTRGVALRTGQRRGSQTVPALRSPALRWLCRGPPRARPGSAAAASTHRGLRRAAGPLSAAGTGRESVAGECSPDAHPRRCAVLAAPVCGTALPV